MDDVRASDASAVQGEGAEAAQGAGAQGANEEAAQDSDASAVRVFDVGAGIARGASSRASTKVSPTTQAMVTAAPAKPASERVSPSKSHENAAVSTGSVASSMETVAEERLLSAAF